MSRHVALYLRVSTKRQDTRSQEPDMQRWVEAFAASDSIQWYRDKASGKTMERPAWQRLETDMAAGKVAKVVVWRLDRLGRTAAGLTALFEELQRRGIGFESVRDRVDLDIPAGRLMANVLASVAAYENEVRSERICAGQAAARAAGKRWGGSKKGRRIKVSDEQIMTIRSMYVDGATKSAMARATGLNRPTVYSVLDAGWLW
jgi:DNA invertase Pin-like site-specific DNA recombinase